jgi:hypothetical protein
METQDSKRIKIFHQPNITSQISLNEINDKLNYINSKLITLDNKINQIGNISTNIVKNSEIIKSKIIKVLKSNETNKLTLLKEIGEIQKSIIQKLLINKPISNNMLNAYS